MQNVFLDIFRTMANFDARQGGSSYREVRYVGCHMSDNPKVIYEKPKLPILWLDTSVIIKLTKVERGEKLQQAEVDRPTRLRALVRELIPAGKLILPQSDQEEKYVAKRLDPEIHRNFLGLPLGVNMKHRQGISDWQAQLGMKGLFEGR